VFIGVGALMEKGLKLGADGIVPSVGNLIPDVCHQLCAAAQKRRLGRGGKTFGAHERRGRALPEGPEPERITRPR
jgi:dihydrodipicolinate synthase/N-acetylneuraminate lyase